MTADRGTRFPQPLDVVAVMLMLLLGLLIGLTLWGGEQAAPRIKDFSWQERQVGAEDIAFVLHFSRPMEHDTVEANLTINPSLPGKVSWAGRRMAYTLTQPAPYGTAYEVRLQGARDSFKRMGRRPAMEPFVGRFRSRDRAFAYIGIDGDEQGRLILYNLTQQKKQVLTPKNLVVMNFDAFPKSDRILFSAYDRQPNNPQAMLDQRLYSVTTGIQVQSPQQPSEQTYDFLGRPLQPVSPPTRSLGELQQILDSKDYQNLKFDLAPDGKTLVVQRISRRNSADSGPWIVKLDEIGNVLGAPTPLKSQGGDFLITPDSNSLAIAQGEGMAILPLQPDTKALDFLPKFGMVLNFSGDGSQAAMVKFNKDYTRSLFLVTTQGVQKELLRITGSILDAQFDPQNQTLYCLLTRLIPGETYQEQPFIAIVDLKTAKVTPWLVLPNQRDIEMHLAPDGLALLFDQLVSAKDNPKTGPRNSSGEVIATSRLWLLPIANADPAVQARVQPEELPLPGFHPRWLP
ncbi:hypothetical protein BST81_17355 [Leptolyngbya sp. 'hensonii']|uniref:hypothetical protein n=1 Tax=Leptolyngbya sp. 'hensonii' TaxID=1922337 RepID=UPI00094F89CA|nr:hypothetical protein [Leptolyngbya sp. 'hensonii']OLP17242.1 hypothetical protein BST81_17355 [Leptolyngbya sp. 'hensonii']